MIRMMNGPDDFVGPVNLGNQGEFTILELGKLVVEGVAPIGSPSRGERLGI